MRPTCALLSTLTPNPCSALARIQLYCTFCKVTARSMEESGSRKVRGFFSLSVCLTSPCRQCPEPVPPYVPPRWQEISAGCRCLSVLAAGGSGWTKIFQAGRDCSEGSQAQLSPSSEPKPCVTAQSSSGTTWSLQKPWSPVLQLWQEIEDSSDEFFKFILMDYVACTFNILDFCFGEEALDLWVVCGAAGQGNMP